MTKKPLFISRLTLTLVLLLLSAQLYAQKKVELVKVSPNWEVGTVKNIHVDFHTQVTFDDSIVRQTKQNYDVKIKVLSVEPDITIRWTSENDQSIYQFNIPTTDSNPFKTQINQALKNAEYEILSSSYDLKFENNSSIIHQWENGLELLRNAEFHQKKKLKSWCADNEISEKEQFELEINFSKELNKAFNTWKHKILAKVNSFFESYQVSFSLNHLVTEKSMTKDLLQMHDDETEFPGAIAKKAVQVNDKLILSKDIEYDKDFVTSYLRNMGGSFKDITINEVHIFEKDESIFDLNSTWLISHTKNLYFEVKGMKTINRTVIVFK